MERFHGKYNVDPSTGCWVWTASRNGENGYGVFHYVSVERGRTIQTSAHRFAYTQLVGPIPAGMMVCHTCDNRICVNPEHLFLGTAGDNKQDEVLKGRHARGQTNGMAILTEDLVRTIRSLYVPRRYAARRIARQLGLNESTVHNVISGDSWRHVV